MLPDQPVRGTRHQSSVRCFCILHHRSPMTSVELSVSPTAQLGCLSIGNFDGVHLGHVLMLKALKELAVELHAPAVVVTFDPHPIAVLRPEFTPPVLTTITERVSLLRAQGADEVVVLPVTRSLLQMSAAQFFSEVVELRFRALGVVEGPNFHFGHDRLGDVNLLCQLCSNAGVHCRIVSSHDVDGCMISSSRIRELLCSRALAAAVKLLGHPYRLTGVVRRGAGRGKTLGFPTANLAEIRTLLPAHGVYSGHVNWKGSQYPAAVSIGPNPTFGEHREKVECHIIDLTDDLYDRELSIDLVTEIRPLQSFASADDLVRQVQADIEFCRKSVRREH
jgi:riboflavin kinase/FMN adenylyltransferase